MNEFSNQVVLLTGGGAGIGRAAALTFATKGARVFVTGRRAEPLAALAMAHENIHYCVADSSVAEDAARTVRDVIDRSGRLDVLGNNAGAGAVLPLEQASGRRISDIFAVNVFGPSLLASAAIPHLRETRGCIMNVSSTFGQKAAASLSHYEASKAALDHLTRCWALELAPLGGRVNAIAAGPTDTDFLTERMNLSEDDAETIRAQERARIPFGRLGTLEEVTYWIVTLASPAAAWVTDQILTVGGGLSVT